MPDALRSYKSLLNQVIWATTPQVAYVVYAHLDAKEGDEILITTTPPKHYRWNSPANDVQVLYTKFQDAWNLHISLLHSKNLNYCTVPS